MKKNEAPFAWTLRTTQLEEITSQMVGLLPFGIFLMKMEVSNLLAEREVLFPTLLMLICSGLIFFAYMKIAIPVVMQKGHVKVNPLEIVLALKLFSLSLYSRVESFYIMKSGTFDPNKEIPLPGAGSSSGSGRL